jgi:putative ABC transport system substrate-binding protein
LATKGSHRLHCDGLRRAGVAQLLCLAFALVAGAAAVAQVGPKTYRLGMLAPGDASYVGVSRALAARGFEEGRNLVVDLRHGSPRELPRLAREVVATNPDAILAVSGALPHARAATASIPIVSFGPDPVEQGYAESFSRPGGNVTGVGIFGAQLDGKRLELLAEAVPGRRIGVLLHQATPSAGQSRREVLATARQIGVDPVVVEIGGPEEYAAAFETLKAAQVGALVITASAFFFEDRHAVGERASAAGLVTACEWGEMAESTCTMAYGPLRRDLYDRVADLVVRVLQGARPAELPIEGPEKFELVINLKAAARLGVTITPAVVARADKVIE